MKAGSRPRQRPAAGKRAGVRAGSSKEQQPLLVFTPLKTLVLQQLQDLTLHFMLKEINMLMVTLLLVEQLHMKM